MARSIIAVIDDLFFAAKIRGTAEQLGAEVRFARTLDAVIDAARAHRPELIIANLQSPACDPAELAQRLKSDAELRSVPLLGFFSHVHVELQRKAQEAGFDRTVPNSMLLKTLTELLTDTSA